jgi:hypothetical protein
MIVLNTNISQTFPIIPTRISDGTNNRINFAFTDETTKEIFYKVSLTRIESYDTLIVGSPNLDFLKENRFYNLVVSFENTNEVIYKDRVFCTNQPIASYSINKDEYTLPNIDNNDYITI